MEILIGDEWEQYVADAVASGRFATANELVNEGLRLVEERETRLSSLREMIESSFASGEVVTDEEVGDALDATLAELVRSEA